MNKKIKELRFSACLVLAGTLSVCQASELRDSVGVENLNGKRVILHRVESGETYYGISRRYSVDPKNLISFNNNVSLRPGLIVKVATNKPYAENALVRPSGGQAGTATASTGTATAGFTEYKVGPKETLFALSRRFGVSVDEIKRTNGLTSDNLNAGQLIKIPNQQTGTNAVVITDEDLVSNRLPDSVSPTADSVVDRQNDTNATAATRPEEEEKSFEPTNKYGLKQVTASGIGVWMDDIGGGESGKMLALHNSAPVGTVVQITNPMNNRMTYAKVVGKFNESAQNKDAVIVISKSVAGLLGVIDRRFQVKISY